MYDKSLSGRLTRLLVRQSIKEVGGTIIDLLWEELMDVIVVIFRGENIIFFASVTTLGYGVYRKIKKSLIQKQSSLIKDETATESKEQNDKIEKIEKQQIESKEQNDKIEKIEKQQIEIMTELNNISVDVIRMQILSGITSESFSKSELTYFYDKYTARGGNSFVSEKVKVYLEREDIK